MFSREDIPYKKIPHILLGHKYAMVLFTQKLLTKHYKEGSSEHDEINALR